MADTFSDIQSFASTSNKRTSLLEKWKKRKAGVENLLGSIGIGLTDVTEPAEKKAKLEDVKPVVAEDQGGSRKEEQGGSRREEQGGSRREEQGGSRREESLSKGKSREGSLSKGKSREESLSKQEWFRLAIMKFLTDRSTKYPLELKKIVEAVKRKVPRDVSSDCILTGINEVLAKFERDELLTLSTSSKSDVGRRAVVTVNRGRIDSRILKCAEPRKAGESSSKSSSSRKNEESSKEGKAKSSSNRDSIEELLSLTTCKEKQNKEMSVEILELLQKPTAMEKSTVEKFRSVGGQSVQEFCTHGTKDDCARVKGRACSKLHFRKIIQDHTDTSLGDCSFLNTCFHMDSCKFIHYEVDYSTQRKRRSKEAVALTSPSAVKLYPAQWVQCDLRTFDLSVLGKFSVIMADPPWDIHMELPYGTMSDNEMRALNVGLQCLQDEGLIFLWVTGRAMELGRDCLSLWGYEQVEEIVWVKTNQLQRIIRTGRTGHWLNHGKEHCLVGLKGSVEKYNRGLDCDVIVAEVRATSHKPDEIYGLIERLSPGTRKLEMFGRLHNVQPNWITLGNQLDGVRLLDPDVVQRFNERYPDGNCMKPAQPQHQQQQGKSSASRHNNMEKPRISPRIPNTSPEPPVPGL